LRHPVWILDSSTSLCSNNFFFSLDQTVCGSFEPRFSFQLCCLLSGGGEACQGRAVFRSILVVFDKWYYNMEQFYSQSELELEIIKVPWNASCELKVFYRMRWFSRGNTPEYLKTLIEGIIILALTTSSPRN
jgi:hypothetical protein